MQDAVNSCVRHKRSIRLLRYIVGRRRGLRMHLTHELLTLLAISVTVFLLLSKLLEELRDKVLVRVQVR